MPVGKIIVIIKAKREIERFTVTFKKVSVLERDSYRLFFALILSVAVFLCFTGTVKAQGVRGGIAGGVSSFGGTARRGSDSLLGFRTYSTSISSSSPRGGGSPNPLASSGGLGNIAFRGGRPGARLNKRVGTRVRPARIGRSGRVGARGSSKAKFGQNVKLYEDKIVPFKPVGGSTNSFAFKKFNRSGLSLSGKSIFEATSARKKLTQKSALQRMRLGQSTSKFGKSRLGQQKSVFSRFRKPGVSLSR